MISQQLVIFTTILALVSSRSVNMDSEHTKEDDMYKDDKDELWLADFDGGYAAKYTDYVDGMVADSPMINPGDKHPHKESESWVCPPPPLDKAPDYYCHMQKCKGDSECKQPNQKCCFNGCVYSCLNTLPPPPLVDWIKEPPRRLLAGNSWLVPGPENSSPGESCTTDFDTSHEDALLCAHGYICHITYAGDPNKGIPNRGKCIKDNDNGYRGPKRFRLATTDHEQNSKVCVFENAIFVEGSRFSYRHHMCECMQNTITCTFGKDEYDNINEYDKDIDDIDDSDENIPYDDYIDEEGLLDPIE